VSGRKRNAISWAFAEAINELYLAVRRASDEERQALRAHIDSLTMTNCWWAEYEAAPVIRNALDGKHWWAEYEAAPVIRNALDPFEVRNNSGAAATGPAEHPTPDH